MTASHEKINSHRELPVSSPWAHGDHGGHGSRTNEHGLVTARRGHSSVTARSQLNHGIFSMITAQSRLGHSSITAQVMAQSRLAVTILVTVSSRWVHGELTVSSRWAVTVANFFLMGLVQIMAWCRTIKPLSEAMLVCCTDTYMHHVFQIKVMQATSNDLNQWWPSLSFRIHITPLGHNE